jgi:endonuclease G, mitochondrial
MSRFLIILLISLVLLIFGCKPKYPYSFEIPTLLPDEDLICHTYYCFVYEDEHKQSKWLAYKLGSDMTTGDESRSSRFFIDTLVVSGTATDTDYKGSGFDRGHLVPAGDMAFCEIAMKESFYYSNISPQLPAFNRGIWKKLEANVRDYSQNLHEIYVVTGPVLSDGLTTIGDNKVSIPEYFYKVVMVYNDSIKQSIAFLMPNKRGDKNSVYCYSLTVRELEDILNIDFFPSIKKKEADRLEMSIDTCFWKNLNGVNK